MALGCFPYAVRMSFFRISSPERRGLGGWKIIRVESGLGKNGKLFTHLTMNKNQDMREWTYVSHIS